MRLIFSSIALILSLALINLSWAGQGEKQDTKGDKQDKQDKVLDVGKGIEIKSSLDNAKDKPFDAKEANNGAKKKAAHKVFLVNLQKGKTYQIDMLFDDMKDPYLFLYDAKGTLLDQNDDVADGDLNSQITFMAKDDGVYRIVCTSFGDSDEGGFKLKITPK